jgi:hypothetical protein
MSQWDQLIQAAGQRYNVDPQLIAALVHVESSGNPKAYNAITGATGLGQQIPATAKSLGIDPKDPAQSIEGVAKLLNENLNRYGNPEQAVLAYHGGTDQSNWGPKTQDYLRKVTARYGAPAVASTSQDSAFEARFGPRPTANRAAQQPADNAQAAFSARFGARPEKAAMAAEAAAPAAPAAQAPESSSSLLDLVGRGLEYLGETGLSNANAIGRGISDALDAPAEWLAYGAEKSGLTGALNSAGLPFPTYEGQVELNRASRAAYDQANPEPGIQGTLGRVAGNIGGVLVPIAGAEAAITQGAQAASRALGNPQALARAGEFLRGNGGLLSRMTYGAGQGAAGGALLSGGGQESSTGEQAALGAALGAAAPVAGAGIRYIGNAGRALAAPFTEAGRAGIAQRAVQAEAAKDPLNQAQNVLGASSRGAPGQSVAAAPAAQAAERAAADDAVNRAAASGRIDANFDEIVPGSQPTLAQATGNAGLAALERAAMSRQPNAFAERQLSNYAARNAYLSEIKGTPETLAAAVAKRDEEALPFLRDALAGARPANANPVMDEITTILEGRAGQRDEVVKALGRVRDKLDLGEGKGLQSDVEQLYGIRQSINDQLATVAGRDNSASQLASRELIQVRDKLDDQIQQAAPGFKEFLSTYASLSRPVDAQRYLQGLDLTDQTSQRITLNKVKSALTRIEKQRAASGANEAKSISDEQLSMLRNLQSDLQREAHSSRGMAIGSNTFQNFATNQLIDSMLPGKLGAVAPVTPGAIGGALGYALGGPVGAGIGAVGGQQVGGIASRAMNAQAPEIEARLIDYLLNPSGGELLRRSADPGAANLLLRRAAPIAPTGLSTSGQNNR